MKTIEELLHRRGDLSTFVVHFTRDTGAGPRPPATAQANLLSILTNRTIWAGRTFGSATRLLNIPQVAATQRVVCFTETPLEHAWMMCEEIPNRDLSFNGYGVAFTKTFVRRRGVNPVWYLDITPGFGIPGGHDWLTNDVEALLNEAEQAAMGHDGFDPVKLAQSPILRLTPFIEQMGPLRGGLRKEFWWEREWRCVGDLSFTPADIVVVFAPEADHDLIRDRLTAHEAYEAMPHLVDATWGLERMIAAIVGVDDVGPFPTAPPAH